MKIEKQTWWIAHNNADVIHYGYQEKGEVLTGQPELETFDNEADYLARLEQLGVEPEKKRIDA